MYLPIALLIFTVSICQGKSNEVLMNRFEKLSDELTGLKEKLEFLNAHDESSQIKSDKDDEFADETSDEELAKIDYSPLGEQHKRSIPRLFADESGESQPYKCAFEDSCQSHFTLKSEGDKFEWKTERSQRDLPDRSETNGQYLVAKIYTQLKRNEHATLSTVEFPIMKEKQCAAFYYYMHQDHRHYHGCDVARFSVILSCEGQDDVLLKLSGSQGKEWKHAMFNINKPVGTKCKFHWKAAKGLSDYGKVAVDEIAMYYEACPGEGLELPSRLGCNFQEGMCTWQQSGDLRWKHSNHRTPSFRTGPNDVFEGHIRGSHIKGNYVYVESSLPNFPGKTAILTSGKVYSEEPQCLRFLANMHGENEGSLEVAVQNDTDATPQVLKTFQGNKGVDWFEVWVNLPVKQKYNVIIKATTGDGPRGDIAVDDVIIQNGACLQQTEIVKCDFANGVKHPCYAVTDEKCKYTLTNDTVNGRNASVINVKRTDCNSQWFWTSVNIPAKTRTPRKSCFSVDYKVGRPERMDGRCHIDVNHVRMDPNNPSKVRHTFRLHPRLDDSYENGEWLTYKKTMNTPINVGDVDNVSVAFRPYHHCSDVSFTNLEVKDGPC